MCSGGCTRAIALVFLIIANVAAVVHFISPYWVNNNGLSTGLWGVCDKTLDFSEFTETLDGCSWFSDNDFAWEKLLEDWQYACQGLSGFGMLFMLLAIPIGCGSLCCCKSDRLAFFTGATTIFAGVLMGVAIGLWGWYVHELTDIIPFVSDSKAGEYQWGYYVGIGAVLLSWIAGSMFFCSRGSKADRY